MPSRKASAESRRTWILQAAFEVEAYLAAARGLVRELAIFNGLNRARSLAPTA